MSQIQWKDPKMKIKLKNTGVRLTLLTSAIHKKVDVSKCGIRTAE
jgi:hypothetical protein